MRRHLPIRLAVCAALAGSASLAMVLIPGSSSGAAVAHTQKTVVCTSLTGNTTKQAVSGCSGSDVSQTGATGTIVPHVNTTTKKGTADITWKTGDTTIESTTYVTSSDSSCPTKAGYTKLARATTTSKVTGGTATALIGSTSYKSTTCEYAKGGIHIFNQGNDTF